MAPVRWFSHPCSKRLESVLPKDTWVNNTFKTRSAIYINNIASFFPNQIRKWETLFAWHWLFSSLFSLNVFFVFYHLKILINVGRVWTFKWRHGFFHVRLQFPVAASSTSALTSAFYNDCNDLREEPRYDCEENYTPLFPLSYVEIFLARHGPRWLFYGKLHRVKILV